MERQTDPKFLKGTKDKDPVVGTPEEPDTSEFEIISPRPAKGKYQMN